MEILQITFRQKKEEINQVVSQKQCAAHNNTLDEFIVSFSIMWLGLPMRSRSTSAVHDG